MMKKSNLIIGIVLVIVVLAGGAFWYVNNQNQETIVDLGNGWKSYHHNKIGITVKVPKDAMINYDCNDEHIVCSASFSKGLIGTIGVDMSYNGKWKNKKNIYQRRVEGYRDKVKRGVIRKYTEYAKFQGKKVKIGKLTRENYYETKLADKEIFVRYMDEKYDDNQGYYRPHNTLSFIGISYGKNYFININVKEIYKQYPYLKDVSFEKLGEEYTKIIKPYILNIDGL